MGADVTKLVSRGLWAKIDVSSCGFLASRPDLPLVLLPSVLFGTAFDSTVR